jgi:hypothetical protein
MPGQVIHGALGPPQPLTKLATANAHTGILRAVCNPYGAEQGGPKHLLGGLYGPEYEGRYHWHCENFAIARFVAICEQGHRSSNPMPLCQSHAHEIQRRQMGLCPPCAWPPEARMLQVQTDEWGALLMQTHPFSPEGKRLQTLIADAANRMTEMYVLGLIRKNPLTLTEVS